MRLIENLYRHFHEKARHTRVSHVSVGLRYTAVLTDDGGMGLAYTNLSSSGCCATKGAYRDYEERPAVELLEQIKDSSPLHRSMGLALVNAMNYRQACELREDSGDGYWMDAFGVGKETRVAMVGFFRPLMKLFKERGALVEVLDDQQGVGDRVSFYGKLDGWADVLLLTSTSILNASTEEVLGRLGPEVKVVMLGPSTPLIPEAFSHLPVHVLAGTVPIDKNGVLKAVRHGEGTPVIHRFSRKAYTVLPGREFH